MGQRFCTEDGVRKYGSPNDENNYLISKILNNCMIGLAGILTEIANFYVESSI